MRRQTILAGVAALALFAAAGHADVAQGGVAGAEGGRYRSYAAVADAAGGGFRASVAGGYSADQLMGRDVVGPDGNEIAEVSDLLVEPDDRIRKTIVDMGGFLGVGAKPVVLDIGRLQRRGDSGDLHTSMTEEWLRALPRCERDGEGYYVQDNGGWPDGGRRAGEPDPARAGTSPSPDAPCRGWAEPDWRAPRSSPGLLASGSARSCASSGKSRS